MDKKTIKDLEVKNKRVIVRVDFNVPLDEHIRITDDSRIKGALPTIKYLIEHGAKVILMSHLGRPKGKVKDEFRLTPVAERLSALLGINVKKTDDCIGKEVSDAANSLKAGEVLLLENLRFHVEEEKNDPAFAKQLASLADIYVNDAFGTCHRAHASTEGITKYLPSVAGFLVSKEIEYFEKATKNPDKPYIAILGGAKVSDKIDVITNLSKKVDAILIGGAMAYTFLKSLGVNIGNSKLEEDKIDLAKEILSNAKSKGVNIILPADHVIADKIDANAHTETVDKEIPEGKIGLDIGPKTVKKFEDVLGKAKTVIWNGPVGFFEIKPFSKGTEEIARFLSNSAATTIIGGGDTAAAVYELGLSDKMSHISTGGGASLEYLEGKELPGISALLDKEAR
ncbi:MAG: phosphoglycerate kinase [Candidatus Omnitrophica bacterium]|nr:phosphoglycerate kinase [Candidatus Omnitrophota bacterium]